MEILIEKKLAELFPAMSDSAHNKQVLRKSQRTEADGYTMTTLREELDTIRLVPLYINGKDKPRYISTNISNTMKKFFTSLGIVNSSDPQYLRFQSPKSMRNKNQLDLTLGC